VETRIQKRATIGQNIARIRLSKKMTQVQLAKLAGIDRRYVYDIETDRKSPTINVTIRLRNALKCSWRDVLRGL